MNTVSFIHDNEFLALVGSNRQTAIPDSSNIDDLVEKQSLLVKSIVDLDHIILSTPPQIIQALNKDLNATIELLTKVLLSDSKKDVTHLYKTELRNLLVSIRERELRLLTDSSISHYEACSLLFINGIVTSTLFISCSFFLHRYMEIKASIKSHSSSDFKLHDAAMSLMEHDSISLQNAVCWTPTLATIFYGYGTWLHEFLQENSISYDKQYLQLVGAKDHSPNDELEQDVLDVIRYCASFRFRDEFNTLEEKKSCFETAVPRITAMQMVHWNGFGSSGAIFEGGSVWQSFPTLSYGMNFQGTMITKIILEMRNYFPTVFEAWWKSYGSPKQARVFEDAAGVGIPTSTGIATHISSTHDPEFRLNVTCGDIIWKNIKLLNEEKRKEHASWCDNLKLEEVMFRNMMQPHTNSQGIFDIDGDSPPESFCDSYDAYLCSLAWHQTGDRQNRMMLKRLLYFSAKLVKSGGLLCVVEPSAERCHILNLPLAVNIVDREGNLPDLEELLKPIEGEPEHYKSLSQLWKPAKDSIPAIAEIEGQVENQTLKMAFESLVLVRTDTSD